jgi:hypothetical protein
MFFFQLHLGDDTDNSSNDDGRRRRLNTAVAVVDEETHAFRVPLVPLLRGASGEETQAARRY